VRPGGRSIVRLRILLAAAAALVVLGIVFLVRTDVVRTPGDAVAIGQPTDVHLEAGTYRLEWIGQTHTPGPTAGDWRSVTVRDAAGAEVPIRPATRFLSTIADEHEMAIAQYELSIESTGSYEILAQPRTWAPWWADGRLVPVRLTSSAPDTAPGVALVAGGLLLIVAVRLADRTSRHGNRRSVARPPAATPS
jgi:hypothetical protein